MLRYMAPFMWGASHSSSNAAVRRKLGWSRRGTGFQVKFRVVSFFYGIFLRSHF